jgi:ferric-dicitrate binding protein FerR (iron transport regulator)
MDTLLALGSPRATVASVSGTLYRVPQDVLEPGAAIGENEVIRTGPGSRAVLTLADGSRMDVNERTELSVHAAWSGRVVNLQHGDVIIQAAKQRHGYLRVQTRDSLASVNGTVFAVSS